MRVNDLLVFGFDVWTSTLEAALGVESETYIPNWVFGLNKTQNQRKNNCVYQQCEVFGLIQKTKNRKMTIDKEMHQKQNQTKK